jgi:hypothetical protein
MIEIGHIVAESWVAPEHFHARWCDVAIHTEWAPGMEYLRLAEPLAVRHESHPHGAGSRLELHARMDGPKAAERAAEMAGLDMVLASDLAGLVALVERNATPPG